MFLPIAAFAKEIEFEAYLLNRAKMHSAILFVLNQIVLKCIALTFLKLHVFLVCACSLECDYRAGHIFFPVETLLSVTNLETLLLIMLSTRNNSNLII